MEIYISVRAPHEDRMPEMISPLFAQFLGYLVGLNRAKLCQVGMGLVQGLKLPGWLVNLIYFKNF